MNATLTALENLYRATMEKINSDPDMPSHAGLERMFENAMNNARQILARNGVSVPPLDE